MSTISVNITAKETIKVDAVAGSRVTDLGSLFVDVRSYGSFSAAIDAIGASEKTLLIPNEQAVAADKTVPANITLQFLQGGSLNIATTKTVTINGHVEAGLYQVFYHDNTDGVLGLKESRPEWFGTGNGALLSAVVASNNIILSDNTTYTPDADIVLENKTMRGKYPSTIIKPTAAVTNAIGLNSGSVIEGFTLDGENTVGKVGIKVGTNALSNIMIARDILVQKFTGTNAKGIYIANAVGTNFYNVHSILNTENLCMLGGSSLPTTTNFYSCSFRSANTIGVNIKQAWQVCFYNPLFEANINSGLVINPGAGEIVFGVHIHDGWVEGNYAGTPTEYQLDFNGLTGTVQDITVEGTLFNDSAMSMRFRKINYLSIRGAYIPNVAGMVVIDADCSGWIENEQYGMTTVFSVASDSVINRDNTGPTFNHLHITDLIVVAGPVYKEHKITTGVPGGSYEDSTTIVNDAETYLVVLTEPTGSNNVSSGPVCIVTRQGTGTNVQVLAAGTNFTVSCSNTTSYAIRFTNGAGTEQYYSATILRLY